MKKRAIVFMFIATFFAISCTRHDVNSLTFLCEAENGVCVYIYESGNIVQVFNLPNKSEKMQTVERILNKKEREWENSIVSYAPFIKICGISWTITIQQERAVVNYKDTSGKLQQIVTKISRDEFEEMKEALTQAIIEHHESNAVDVLPPVQAQW